MSQPPTRVVLLGASNLTRGIATVVQMSRNVLAGPVELFIAMGHGRSYGQRTTICGRGLPSILDCGLWEALRGGGGRPTCALITDIGNDIAYGVPVDTLAGWVQACLDRLAEHEARIVMSLPPMASLQELTPWRFGIARTLLFPGRALALDDAVAAARKLTEQLNDLGARRRVTLIEPQGEWYGFDPIHPRRRWLARSFAGIAAGWSQRPAEEALRVRPPLAHRLRLRTLTPRQWWVLGRRRGRPQPCWRLRDGSEVSLY